MKKGLCPATTFHGGPSLCHPACPGVPWERLTYLRQVKDGMNMGKRCLQSRPRGPSAKCQPSPEGLGIQRQPVERRRCGTTLFVCSLREPVTFSIFSCFLHPTRCCSIPSRKASSCLPRRAVGAKRLADLSHHRGFMARSRRTPAMLVRRHSSELSGHRLQGKLKKSQPPTVAEGSAVPRTVPGNVLLTIC